MSLTMLRMKFKIVILTVLNCSSSRQWGHLVRSHLPTQASQPRTCLQHDDILNGGSVNPWYIMQGNTSFNCITSWNVLEIFQEWLFCPEAAFWLPGFPHYLRYLPLLRFHNLQWQKSSLHSIARKACL